LAEKVGQMTQADHTAVGNLQDVQTYYLGSILSGGGSCPRYRVGCRRSNEPGLPGDQLADGAGPGMPAASITRF
jgi:hypothetical protein